MKNEIFSAKSMELLLKIKKLERRKRNKENDMLFDALNERAGRFLRMKYVFQHMRSNNRIDCASCINLTAKICTRNQIKNPLNCDKI